jgi:hypothetical protein
MTDIAETLAVALKRIQQLENAVTAKNIKVAKSKKSKSKKSESDDDKPKRVLNEGIKAWHVFLKRVRLLMKEMDMGFSVPTEITQFCSALKAKNGDYESWSTEEILEERENWEKPEQSKQLVKKMSKENSAASSVAAPSKKKALPVSDAENSFSDNESEDEPEPEPVKKVKEVKEVKKAGRPKKVVDETPKEAPKKAGRPKKAKEAEDENYKGGIEAFKHKGKTYTKTERHDVIDEDNGVYIGRWDEDTNEIDTKFPEPKYVKKMIAEMGSDDE